jgi:hypothetical protein
MAGIEETPSALWPGTESRKKRRNKRKQSKNSEEERHPRTQCESS